jgi:hypothetical protein
VPDRWRVVEDLGLVRENLLNPYQQNTLKGDRPIYGDAWFLNAGLESHSVYESGRVPASDALGREEIHASLGLTRGNTVFRPPDWQLRASSTLSYAGGASLGARSARERDRERGRPGQHLALRELFVEKHLRTRTESYDFSSVRIGIQPFIADFRGFLFRDESTPALRLFGNAVGNRFQYNLAWLRPLEKDAVSGLSELRLRRDSVWVANLYQQDYPVPGFQVQGTAVYDRDREDGTRDVLYAGLSGDGHVDRVNLTFSAYAAAGREREPESERTRDIRAFFLAAETSIDVDWYRLKAYALFASGDPDPSDGRAQGFDSLRERAQFAGLDAGFFQRESIVLPGGVLLSSRDALLTSLRTAAREERASFVNPGLRLLGVGADLDLLPELRLSLNASYLDFEETAPLAPFARGMRIARHIGEDYSLALSYRPLFTQNIVLRLSVGALASGPGLEALLDGRAGTLHSTRLELTLRY